MRLYCFLRLLIMWPCRLLFRMRIKGRENVPEGAFLMCANHLSFADPVLCAVAIKTPIRFVARADLKKHAFLRLVFRVAGVVPINRGAADVNALRSCVEAIEKGDSIGIFPQGTRIRSKKPVPEDARAGLGLIALHTHASVLPVSLITKNNRIRPFTKVTVVIGKPIPYEVYSSAGSMSRKDVSVYCFAKVCEQFD